MILLIQYYLVKTKIYEALHHAFLNVLLVIVSQVQIFSLMLCPVATSVHVSSLTFLSIRTATNQRYYYFLHFFIMCEEHCVSKKIHSKTEPQYLIKCYVFCNLELFLYFFLKRSFLSTQLILKVIILCHSLLLHYFNSD